MREGLLRMYIINLEIPFVSYLMGQSKMLNVIFGPEINAKYHQIWRLACETSCRVGEQKITVENCKKFNCELLTATG